ncbi:MAG: Crp/Fnr family transcriptional regulator [Alphaproteobacteria bacterium]|nr:MAG: Crp/Fnr family transcriptional regulator [Alphaproteobacteria bacterium]
MPASGSYDIFLRGTFGIEPGGATGRKLRELAKIISVPRGSIAPLDHTHGSLVFIADGSTKLVAHASHDREQIVAFHFGGDLVAIPPDSEHAFSLMALKDSGLIIFPAREFYDRASAEPTIMRVLLDRFQTALFRCRDKALGLGRKNAQERLASFLLTMAERLDNDANGCRVLDLPMSRRDIGDSLGLTIETISRQFSELRAAGLVETSGRSRVVLKDPVALAQRAGHLQ